MFQSIKAAISSSVEQVEDFSQTKITDTLLEWYPDSGTVLEIIELIDNESNKLSKGKISITYYVHMYILRRPQMFAKSPSWICPMHSVPNGMKSKTWKFLRLLRKI